ncbi:MAG: PEP/pyruvate-binding domain-containing protein [Polyangiaceae bacterium]
MLRGQCAFPVLYGLLLALAVFGLGCKDDPRTLELRVVTSDGATPSEWVVIGKLSSGRIVSVACPSGTGDAELSCTDKGARLDGPENGTFTVKARGYTFVSNDVAVADLPVEDDARVLEVPVTALPTFELDGDDATGFDADGLADFESLAVKSDTELGPALLVKFYIADIQTEPRVYFQNTVDHPLHYEFAREVLGVAQTRAEFEASTYHGEDRTAMAGTLVYYPALSAPSEALGENAESPVALTFFPSDDLTPEQVVLAHRLIEERLGFVPLHGVEDRLVYVPAGSVQESDLAGAKDLLRGRGAAWLTREELYGDLSLQILNEGLAYGTLRVLSPEELATTIVSFTDVLILTALPNWLPIVGGTITEELQTPLAHVNLAAHTRGTPNIALPGASTNEDIAKLIGKLVRFEVKDGTYSIEETTLEEAQAFWQSQHHDPYSPEFDDTVTGLIPFDDLHFEDSIFVGVKAANLAELHRAIPEHAPDGFGVPFSYYADFMTYTTVSAASCDAALADCTSEGRAADVCDDARAFCLAGAQPEALWDYATRLAADPTLAADAPRREAALDGLRYHMTHATIDPTLGAALDAEVAARFGTIKVRLRSSTNSEDLEDFSGAGLYTSTGAWATGDQAASLEIRKVWASVWNWKAYEERAFWNIDHMAVRMGVGVHPAFEDEAANGVLITQNIADLSVAGMYVNVQLGEVSVTNPEGGALPEIFSIIPAPTGVQVARQRYSSLSPDAPILTDAEVLELYRTAADVQEYFATLYGVSPVTLALDIEFKLEGKDRHLAFKQARPYSIAGG